MKKLNWFHLNENIEWLCLQLELNSKSIRFIFNWIEDKCHSTWWTWYLNMFITSIIHDCCVEKKKTSKIHIFKKSHFHSIQSKFYFGNTKLNDLIIVPCNTNSNVTIITKIINIYHLLCSIWPLRGIGVFWWFTYFL